MDFLPKLSTGIQCAGRADRTNHSHAVTVAQASTLNLAQLAGDFGAELPLLSGGGLANLELELPIYGKYCGPGHGDPSHCSPDDQVDAACCKHDLCYNQQGYFSCGCDCDFVRSAPSAIANTSSEKGKTAGAALMALAATSPCVAYYQEICVPGIGCKKVPIIVYPGGPEKCLLF